MAKETVGLKIDIDSRSVATAARRSDDLARSSARVSTALGGMARAAAAVGVAATAAVAGVVALTLRIADQADEIAKHSTRIGVSIESYQELTHAMELSGGSIAEASTGIRRLSANLLDASQGVATAVDAFAGLGIETTTAAGGLRSVDDVLADIADEFAAMEDGSLKTARAMELFGRSGATLIPLLNQGSEGIAEMRQEAHELGIVISTETAHAAEALNDDLTRLKGVATGFANQLATHLIPRMRDVVANLTEFAMRAGQSNANFGRLAREGLDAMLSALVIVAQAGIRVTQGILGLRQAWLEMKDSAIDYLNLFRARNIDDSLIEGQIEAIQETVGNLEVLHGSIGALDDDRGPRQLSEAFGEMADMIARAQGHADNFAPDPDPDPTIAAAEELDKFELAAKNASAAVVALNAASEEAARGIAESMALAAEEMQALFDTKAADHAAAERLKQMEAFANATKDSGKQIQKEVEDIGSSLMTVEDVGSKAIGGLVSGLQGLSMAAFWKKDGDALKEFGKMLGKMLIQLGTMAVAYAAVAALGTVFPVLQGVVGPAAGAPALAAVGAGAIAAGALLGAAIPRGAGGGNQPSGGGDGGRPVETSRTTVYNLTLGAGMSQRGMNRALLEQVNSAVGQGV